MPDDILWVSISEQSMTHFRSSIPIKTYRISTSKNPPSCVENSFGTPTGLHVIADKIGAGAAPGTVFKSRVPVGHLSEMPTEERERNLVTTRIIRMRGLEPGHNAGPGIDTYDRFVYIHGTNHPERIGEPFSGGCIELADDEIISLFDDLKSGAFVAIST